MINLIVKFYSQPMMLIGHTGDHCILMSTDGHINKKYEINLVVYSIQEQIDLYNKYFYKFMNLPEHLKINKITI